MKPSQSVLPSGRLLPNPAPSPEGELLDHAERLSRLGGGGLACWVRLSELEARHRREHHLRMAAELFEGEVRTLEGRMFVLSDGDLVFVSRLVEPRPLDGAIGRLRYLFSDDPLARPDAEGFCAWYRLDREMGRFMDLVRQRRDLVALEHGNGDAGARGAPLLSSQLAGLEAMLGRSDLSNHMRNQSVCTLFPQEGPRRIFEEVYVSIKDLAEAVLPGVDLTANPWLFQELTRTLDRRVLAAVAKAPTERPISLNLNVATLLSPEFRDFDRLVPARAKGRLVIELQKLDVLSDLAAFRFARDSVRERGYRLCLDGLTHLTLPFVDRERLGFDLLKLHWSPEMEGGEGASAPEETRRLVAASGTARVILTRCDGIAAIRTGRALGIALFQGRYVERLLRAGIAPPA